MLIPRFEIEKWRRRLREPIMYGIVGGISAACYVCLGVFFSRVLGARPSVALAGALGVMLLPNYTAQRTFTFRSQRNHGEALPRYLATQLVSNLFGMALSELLASQVAVWPWITFSFVALMIAVINFVLLKFWTFVTVNSSV